jgi:hypothetical protein
MLGPRLRLAISFCLAAVSLHGGPTEDAIVAIMRLSDQPNYTWTSSVHDDARLYEIDGRTSAAGFSIVKMPLVNSVRRRLGRELLDNRVELIFRGNARCVLLTKDGWLAPHEVPELGGETDVDAKEPINPANIYMRNGVILNRLPNSKPRKPAAEPRGYSNLQLAICPPHEELGIVVASHREFQADGERVTGTLADLGARLLLVREGQPELTPLSATGSFVIWLRDGFVARYQLELDGRIEVKLPDKPAAVIRVQQRTVTTISQVGKTEVPVPEAARAKLTSG